MEHVQIVISHNINIQKSSQFLGIKKSFCVENQGLVIQN